MNNLTDRQREVYGHLQRGLSRREIARTLRVRPDTVKVHVRAIRQAGFRWDRSDPIRNKNVVIAINIMSHLNQERSGLTLQRDAQNALGRPEVPESPDL